MKECPGIAVSLAVIPGFLFLRRFFMKELGFIRYGEMIRTNVRHLGLCNHVYLEGLWFATGFEGHGLYCIVPHDRIAEGPGGIILLDRNFQIMDMKFPYPEILSRLWEDP